MIIQKSFALAGLLTSLVFAPGLAVAQTPTSPASSPTRVAVLGSASDPASASVLVAALQAAEKERGITINTSHVEYETTKRSGRAGLAEAIAGGDHYEAAILIGAGGDLRDVVEAAQLASVLGFPQLLISMDSATGTPESLALLQKWLVYLGYPPANTAVFMIELDQIRCQTPPGVGSLLDAVLKLAPQPPELRAPFLMPVADVAKSPQGAEAFGEIAAGIIRVGDPVEIVGFREEPLKSTITGVEMFRKLLDRGEAGDNVGLLLRGIDKKDIRRGMVIVKPGSVTAHREFQAQVYVLKKEEGGRHTPFHNRMAPEIIIRTAQVEGGVTVAEQGGGGGGGGAGGIVTGLTSVNVKLIVPIAMDKGLRFAIREGGRTVGAGQVTEIIK